MFFSLTEEVFVFLYACLAGALIMLFYDLISVTGKQKCSVFLLNVGDGIFIIVACAIMMFIIFSASNGIVRGFEFVGAVLGAVLYKLTLSRLVSTLLRKLTLWITAFFKLFFKILLTPLAIMYKMINKCIVVLFYPVASVLRKLCAHFLFRIRISLRTARNAMKKT